MIVSSSIGTAHNHDSVARRFRGVIDAVVVDRWLEEMRVGLEPDYSSSIVHRQSGVLCYQASVATLTTWGCLGQEAASLRKVFLY